jgi:hypothetical protein
MICPGCSNTVTFPVTKEPPLSVCPICGRTVVIDGIAARLAVAEDTRHLDVQQMKDLKRLRPTT